MQNQLTPGQSNLQQSTSNVQPNSTNLQQGGTPATSSEVFTVLSQDAKSNGLQVQSAQTDPNARPQTYLPSTPTSVWIVPVALTAAIIIAIVIWTRLRQHEADVAEEEISEVPVAPAPAKKKTGKKTTRRKRQRKH